jgi:hypothetical protein
MTVRRFIALVLMFSVVAATVIACGSPAPQPQPVGQSNEPQGAALNTPLPQVTAEKINVEVGPNDPQIFMLEPQDESTLESPFFLRVGVSNFPIPISSVRIHVALDAICTPPGNPIPEDAQHVSLPRGVLQEPRFALPAGQHRLCIQASNQDDIALDGPGLTRVIDLTIRAVPTPEAD